MFFAPRPEIEAEDVIKCFNSLREVNVRLRCGKGVVSTITEFSYSHNEDKSSVSNVG